MINSITKCNTAFTNAVSRAMKQGYNVVCFDDENSYRVTSAQDALECATGTDCCTLQFRHKDKKPFYLSFFGDGESFEVFEHTDTKDSYHPFALLFHTWLNRYQPYH